MAEVPPPLWWVAMAPLPPPARAEEPDHEGPGALLCPHPIPHGSQGSQCPQHGAGDRVTSLCFPGDFLLPGVPVAVSPAVAPNAGSCPGKGAESPAAGLGLLETTRSHLLLFLPAKRLRFASPNLAKAPEPRGFLFMLPAATEP